MASPGGIAQPVEIDHTVIFGFADLPVQLPNGIEQAGPIDERVRARVEGIIDRDRLIAVFGIRSDHCRR